MNDAEQLHGLAAPYAVDALDEDERAGFEAHLASCPLCRAEVAELQEAAVGLSEGWETAPPADLRARLLTQVALEPRQTDDTARPEPVSGSGQLHVVGGTRAGRGRGPRAASGGRATDGRRWLLAAAAALVVGTGTWAAVETVGGGDPATSVVRADDAVERYAETPEGRIVVITSEQEDAAVLRIPEGLGAPAEGSVYQAWFVGADGSARSAGLLAEEVLTEGEVLLQGPVADAAAVGLTVEPAGGSEQPTTEPFAVVELG